MKDRSHARGTARPPVTNTNVYLVTSADCIGWAGPHPVDAGPSDQWFPTVAVNPKTNDVGVLYYDGNVDASGLYGDCLAEGRPGTFEIRPLTGPISNGRDSRFFPAFVDGCRRCASFIGDYIGLDYGSDGRAWVAWTEQCDSEPGSRDGGATINRSTSPAGESVPSLATCHPPNGSHHCP